MRPVAIVTYGLLCCALLLAGCTRAPAAPSAADVFKTRVTAADAMLKAGDAEGAMQAYRTALEATGAVDAGGAVAKKMDHAKSVYVARQNLASRSNPPGLAQYITIAADHSDATTEAALARARIVALIEGDRAGLDKELRETVTAIQKDQSVRLGPAVIMATKIDGPMAKDAAAIAGEFGKHAASALSGLQSAGEAADKALANKYAEPAIKGLRDARTRLAAVRAELMKASGGK